MGSSRSFQNLARRSRSDSALGARRAPPSRGLSETAGAEWRRPSERVPVAARALLLRPARQPTVIESFCDLATPAATGDAGRSATTARGPLGSRGEPGTAMVLPA